MAFDLSEADEHLRFHGAQISSRFQASRRCFCRRALAFLFAEIRLSFHGVNHMKALLIAITLVSLLFLGAAELRAQVHGAYTNPYWDLQYQQYLEWQQYHLDYWRQNDPYFDLHVMHYQLYLQRFNPFVAYAPCCYAVGIPRWTTPPHRLRHGAKIRGPKAIRRK